MDGQMGWESSLWSNQHNGIEESFELANPIQEPYEMVDLHHQIVNSDWEDDLGAQLCVIDGLDEDLAVTNPYESLWNLNTICNKNKNNVVTSKEAHCDIVASRKPECLKRSSHQEDGFTLISSKKPRTSSSNISFQQPSSSSVCSSVLTDHEPDPEAVAHMKEMIYRAAAFRPVNLGAEVVERPRRKNVKISSDPQTVAARQRRERISERIKVLQKLVPGGTKMDTASMLDEAASYLKFLRSQVKALENLGLKINHHNHDPSASLLSSSLPLINNLSFPMQAFAPLVQNPSYRHHHVQDQVGFSNTITKC